MISMPMSPITESTWGFVDVVEAERLRLREFEEPEVDVDRGAGGGGSVDCCLSSVSCY